MNVRTLLRLPAGKLLRAAVPGTLQKLDAIPELQREVQELRAEVLRLDADLDESRRLNLRAAELLDTVYEELGRRKSVGAE
jgi:molecular chaperone GrpE (heat shock protein)